MTCEGEHPTKEDKHASPKKIGEEVVSSGEKSINLEESSIFWKGHKILGYHTGQIELKEGSVTFENGDIIAGTFVINMESVTVTELMDDGDDEEEEEGESPHDDKFDLANHLMNEDFFDVGQFPTASFVVKHSTRKGNNYTVTGDMTIKGITKEIVFDATIIGNQIQSELAINRTDFGIKYGSGSFFDNLGDNAIKDKFDLILSLKINE